MKLANGTIVHFLMDERLAQSLDLSMDAMIQFYVILQLHKLVKARVSHKNEVLDRRLNYRKEKT